MSSTRNRSLGLLGIVWGLINGNADGWTSPQILAALGGGAALVAAFVAYEARTRAPMVPLRLFRNRTFSAVNGASLLMYFGMFGSVFLLTQFLQTAQATRRSKPACACSRGRSSRCSSRPSPACSRTASAVARSSPAASRCRP